MKKTILFAIIAFVLSLKSIAQAPTYVENFDSTLTSEGMYPRMYINTAPGATITSSKPSASELALTLNNVSGVVHGQGFLLGKRNSVGGWDPLDLRGKNLTVTFMIKSTVEIPSFKVQVTDNRTPGGFLDKFFTIPGGNILTKLEYTFTPEEIATKQIDLGAIDGLRINFNAIGEAVNSIVTFDMISVGQDVTTSTLAAEMIGSSKVYPNPSSERVNFESMLSTNANVRVSLCDMVGKELASYTNENNNVVNGSFDVSNLEKGLYNITYSINGAVTNSELVMVK